MSIFRTFLDRYQQKRQKSAAEAFEDIRRLAVKEDFILESPPRRDRANPFSLD